ncbi:MAG: hypothetical protein JWM80_5672, partial [Cyanobacteria bacterium RYN_339]|nr:hypothetical protein [Cyanobacteria bacterium RYN_339]
MPPAKKPTPKKPTKTQRPSWMIPAAIVGVVLFLGLVVVNKIHQGAARAHAAALAAGVSPDRAAEMTSDASILSHIAGSADRKQRAAEIQAKAAAAFAQEMADVHPEKPRATADPAAPIDGLLAKGDLAGAQRLLP